MEHQIIDTPTELDDRDLDLVAGGGDCGGGGGSGTIFTQNSAGLINLLNGNNVNILGIQGVL